MLNVLKKEMVVDNSHHLLLSDVPFVAGEKVLVFVTSETALHKKIAQWRTLFKETQTLPQTQEITEADIDAEIEAFRSGL